MVNILVFKQGETCFGIETSYVRAITKNLMWTDNGVVEYEGQKVCVINFLGKRVEKCRETDFIVASCKNSEFAIPVDEAIDIFQVLEKDIMPIPVFVEKNMSKNFFKGMFSRDDILILLVDVSRL